MNTRSKNGNGTHVMMLRYLDGSLAAEDVARLSAAMKASTPLQEAFAGLLLQEAQLMEIDRELVNVPARPARRVRTSRFPAWISGLSAAAALLLVVGGWWMLRYPTPRITQGVRVARGELARGALLRTGSESGAVHLGGYCDLTVEPNSEIALEGDAHNEQIHLSRGAVVCRVQPAAGRFAVRTDMGTIRVTGTKFRVQVSEEGGEEMSVRRLLVKVMVGAVVLSGSWGSETLVQGAERSRYKSKDPTQERVKGKDGRKNAIDDGTVVGTVLGKGPGWVQVRSVGGQVDRYVAEWKGGMPKDGGGPDKRTVRKINGLDRGDLISIKWYVDDHLRILKIKRLKRAKDRKDLEEQMEGEHEQEGERKHEAEHDGEHGDMKSLHGFSGMVHGKVAAVGEDHFLYAVDRLLRVWKDNKASAPKHIVGRTVRVCPRWQKGRNGKWHKVEGHVAFIRTLRKGQDLTLEIRHAEREQFAILELNEEQRKAAAGAAERDGREEHGDRHEEERGEKHEEEAEGELGGARGFYGMVRGVITAKGDHNQAIHIKVTKVDRVWKKNKAPNPKVLEGQTIIVTPKRGYHREAEQRILFHLLQKGEAVWIEIQHEEGDRFVMVETTKEQRERVAKARKTHHEQERKGQEDERKKADPGDLAEELKKALD